MDHVEKLLSLLEHCLGLLRLSSLKWIFSSALTALVLPGLLTGTALAKENAPQGNTGVLFGPNIRIDAAKQIVASHAITSVAPDGSIQSDFAADSKTAYVKFRPASNGIWNLSDSFQVQIRVKNTGQMPIRPLARLDSKSGPSDTVPSPVSILPNCEGEITIPFAAIIPAVISTDPRQEKLGPGTWAEQNWAPKKGTGTAFSSNQVNGVTVMPEDPAKGGSLAILSITAGVPAPALPEWLGQRPPVDTNWVKTFDESFDTSVLNLHTWNIYTNNYWDKLTHFSKDNVYIKDGNLVLHYEKKTGYHNDNPNDKKTVGKTDYACGFADTYGKWAQRYGYFEARVKLPKAPGLWPAFWLMPDRGAKSEPQWGRSSTGSGAMEFDIFEYLTGWGPFRSNLAFHWDDYGNEHKSAGTSYNYVLPDKDGFVTVGLYWVPGLAVCYAQGKEVLRWESPRISTIPSYMIFDMVSGGWDNVPLDATKLPDDFVIDYVRVWQRKDLASPDDGPKPNTGKPSA